jgi:hypothetical protein
VGEVLIADEAELRKAVELARLIVREAERSARWPSLALILNRGARRGKPMRTRKRAGAMPPIVTVIIIVASVVAATLAAYFIYTTTARGIRQVMLTVIGQPTLYATDTGVELRVTFKNDGTADVNLAGSVIYVQDKNKKAVEFKIMLAEGESALLRPGDSKALKYAAEGVTLDRFPDGALATLQTKDGYQTSFAVAKP